MTKVANAIANITASNTVMALPPGPHDVGHAGVVAGCDELSLRTYFGSEPTTLEYQLSNILDQTFVLEKSLFIQFLNHS